MRTPLASTSRVKLESFVVSSRRAVSSAPIAAGRCFVSLPRCGSTSSSAPSLHDPFPRPAHAASPPRLNPWRHFSTTSNRRSQPSPPASSLSQQEYNSLSDDVFDSLVSQLEHLVDESPDGAERDWEIEYSQGVLTLKVPPTGTYVINKQPPNKQIWLSSPTSGPKRFDFAGPEGKAWTCTKDGQSYTLEGLLNEELSKVFGQEVTVLEDVE